MPSLNTYGALRKLPPVFKNSYQFKCAKMTGYFTVCMVICTHPRKELTMKKAVYYSRNPKNSVFDEAAIKDLGFTLSENYTDTGSGNTTDRPGLQHLLAAAEKGEFDAVIVNGGNQISRDISVLKSVLARFAECGVIVIDAKTHMAINPDSLALYEIILTSKTAYEPDEDEYDDGYDDDYEEVDVGGMLDYLDKANHSLTDEEPDTIVIQVGNRTLSIPINGTTFSAIFDALSTIKNDL